MTAGVSSHARTDPARVIATLTLAFSADPVVRWLLPETDRYHSAFPDLVRLSGGAAFDSGTADVMLHGLAAALWIPPGIEPDGAAFEEFFQRHIDPGRLGDVFAWGELVGEHHPTEPHWYLAQVGVDPHWQGRGYGSALLREGLARCDRDRLPAYLEAGSLRNRLLYERHGFAALAEIQVGDSPPAWPMLRRPT